MSSSSDRSGSLVATMGLLSVGLLAAIFLVSEYLFSSIRTEADDVVGGIVPPSATVLSAYHVSEGSIAEFFVGDGAGKVSIVKVSAEDGAPLPTAGAFLNSVIDYAGNTKLQSGVSPFLTKYAAAHLELKHAEPAREVVASVRGEDVSFMVFSMRGNEHAALTLLHAPQAETLFVLAKQREKPIDLSALADFLNALPILQSVRHAEMAQEEVLQLTSGV